MAQIPGYEFIGSFKTEDVDYGRPGHPEKVVTLKAFVKNSTKDVFVGSNGPQIKLEELIKGQGKEPKRMVYDIAEKIQQKGLNSSITTDK
jgi:hypothetical protein